MIIDLSDQILGRIASKIAKLLLKGKEVHAVNASKAIISGQPKKIVERYLSKRRRGDPHHGPFFPSTVEGIFKRSVRGMLPYKKAKGRKALTRLKVYRSNPFKKEGMKLAKPESKLRGNFIRLKKLSLRLKGG